MNRADMLPGLSRRDYLGSPRAEIVTIQPVSRERALDLRAEFRHARAQWIADYPGGRNAALATLASVFGASEDR